RLLVGSIATRDLIILQGVVLLVAAGFVIMNFIVDLLYAVLDPRIRHGHAGTHHRRRRRGATGKAWTPIGTAVLDGDRLDDFHVRGRDPGARAAAAEPDRHGHAGTTRSVFHGALARNRRSWPRRALEARLRRADFARGRAVRAVDRAYHRRRARHARRLFPWPVRVGGGRQHGRAAGVSAPDPGAGRDRLSRAVDPQPHL